ncbi:CCC motif membrane protein [Pedobacter sp. UC225_65]|uniref:CCC motif membrane protein n=1 Tax=Pedobacter sp. UC225_65 TaxID=3350173 RepID=UPI00366B6099
MSEEQSNPQENPQPAANPNPQNPFPPQNGGFGFGMQQSLPNATVVLILGILSIVTCCCYGVIGLILGIVALILSKKDKALYLANMAYYTESSYKNLSAGRVCAIIGLVLNILYLLLCIAFIAMFGIATLSDQDAMKEAIENMMK